MKGSKVSVYVDHRGKPAMVYEPLDDNLVEGSVGFSLGNFQGRRSGI